VCAFDHQGGTTQPGTRSGDDDVDERRRDDDVDLPWAELVPGGATWTPAAFHDRADRRQPTKENTMSKKLFANRMQAIISAPTGKLKDKNNQSVRTIHFTLKTDFDDGIGGGLDKHGKAALAGLRTRGLAEVKIPITLVAAKIKLRCGDAQTTFNAVGIEIVGKANMNKDDASPIANIKWVMDYNQKAWQFLGEHFGENAQVSIETRQLELPSIDDATDEGDDDEEAAE
jgi:hypothetical protein